MSPKRKYKFSEKMYAEGDIYLGDHLTRSWTKDERCGTLQTTSPVTSEPGNKTPGTPSTYHTKHCHAPITRTRSSLREPRGSRKNWATKAAIQNVTPEEFQEWKQSFDNLLRSPIGSKLYRDFLESEIAEENLLFWEACEEMKQIKKEKRRHKLIQTIHDDYISVHSPREINIDYKMREYIVEQLNSSSSPDPELFAEAQMQIYHLMHRDSYPRFIASAQALHDKMTRKESKIQQKSVENRRKSGTKSRVLCCYGDDPDEPNKQFVQMEGVETKVCESPKSPVNGKTTTGAATVKHPQEAASSSERQANVTSQKDDVKPPLRNIQVEVTATSVVSTLVDSTTTNVDPNPRKLSADSNSKRGNGVKHSSGDDDVTPEKSSDVIAVPSSSADCVTKNNTSEFEVSIDVIKNLDGSDVTVANKSNCDVIEEIITEVSEDESEPKPIEHVVENESCDVTEEKLQEKKDSKLSDVNDE